MVMDKYYPRQENSSDTLWGKINSLHLSYLEMEESPQKIEHRNKLEDCINKYLCIAHHNQKFECCQTSHVLHKSASKKRDFSGYKAAVGFDAIGRYAANLITKPWRKEYKQIKMYSGFYKHEIESNLYGAESLFEEMGYNLEDPQVLILRGPICPDRVTSVSLDSLMAYVECQILKIIWEEVSQACNTTWLDVLNCREKYAGSPQETINMMIYMQQPQPLPNSKIMQHYYPIPPPPAPPQQYLYPAVPNCCSNYLGYAPFPQPLPYNNYMHIVSKQQPYYVPPTHHHCQQISQISGGRVPTGQLIELDVNYDQPDGPVSPPPPPQSSSSSHYRHKAPNDDFHTAKIHGNKYSDEKKSNNSQMDREEGSGTYESWDYVYRNLESQGYSKDLGERGDLLQQQQQQQQSNAKAANVKKEEQREKRNSKSSTYDNVSDHKPTATRSQVAEAQASGWHCSTCTYLNSNDRDICEMCSKSKRKLAEAYPQVGGSECKKCTFVNDKGQKVCEACGTSLNNSPTYI